MMNGMNGHDNAPADMDEAIKALAAGVTPTPRIFEPVDGTGPFEQKTHALLMESVDRISQQWVNELTGVRENTQRIEQMVLTQAAKVKDHLTRLHLLGVQAMREAQRGREVSARLMDELDQMLEQQTT